MTLAGASITDARGGAAGTITRRAAITPGRFIRIPAAMISMAARGTPRIIAGTGIAGTAIDDEGAPVFRTGRAVPLAAPPSHR